MSEHVIQIVQLSAEKARSVAGTAYHTKELPAGIRVTTTAIENDGNGAVSMAFDIRGDLADKLWAWWVYRSLRVTDYENPKDPEPV